ncbi:hydratase [Sagittula salina]|uniref:Hydratase n=1 Tax=Sagittula salina TaxID=2820268 RepID=A0A940MKL3_9RHOB|nr:hydratase [Sagittula salina]
MTLTDRFAEALIRAHDAAKDDPSKDFPHSSYSAPQGVPTYAEALEIQTRVMAHLGSVGGFKVGPLFPGEPVIAPIPLRQVFVSGAEVPARDPLGIELEMGFELMRPPAPEMRSAPQDFFRPRIVLELVDRRLPGDGHDPLVKLADMQLNAGLVLGAALDGWDGRDFTTFDASLRCGDTQVIDGSVSVPGGSALENLRLFLDHVGDHCGGLRKGQVVITGSVSGCEWFPPGTDVVGLIEGFDPIACRITRA